jgi:hypothetical protein
MEGGAAASGSGAALRAEWRGEQSNLLIFCPLVTERAIELGSQLERPAGFGGHPRAQHPRRAVAHVLRVIARKLGDPIASRVLLESYDGRAHAIGYPVTTVRATRDPRRPTRACQLRSLARARKRARAVPDSP